MIHIGRLTKSFSYAADGWRFAIKKDQNLRIHLVIGAVVVILGLLMHLSILEVSILVAMVVIVIAAELMNSAIEKVIDLITTEHREDARFAKDVSSAMVLTAAIGSVIVGLLVFLPHLL